MLIRLFTYKQSNKTDIYCHYAVLKFNKLRKSWFFLADDGQERVEKKILSFLRKKVLCDFNCYHK